MKWWSKLINLDLNKTENRLKLMILLSAVGLFLGILSSIAISGSSTPEFCQSCHEMKPEYYTWKATSHNQIACTKCHIEPGVFNLILHKMGSVKEIYVHAMKAYNNPIRMQEEELVPNKVCQQCHSKRRVYSTLGDIVIPHDKHIAKGVLCVSCHAGIAHGKIAERKVTRSVPYEDWDETVGEKQTKRELSSPRMDSCIKCHTDRGVSKRCETCHTTYFTPVDHNNKAWKSSHGLTARVEPYSCRKCHSYGSDTAFVSATEPIAKVARGVSFCYNCHNSRPESHGYYKTVWMDQHKNVVAKRGKAYCTVCHSIKKPTPDEQATKTYCNKCHLF